MNTLELVRASTTDGLVLEGAFGSPVGPRLVPIDACLFLHGTGGNFYSRGLLETCSCAARNDGIAALRVNTRGHDGICALSGRAGAAPGGAAFETLSECRYDITAWIEWLRNRGYQRIALVGHSVGAVKSIYSQVHQPHPQVAAILAISPPRFHHATFDQHPLAGSFRTDYARARELCQRGAGDTLLHVRQPLPYIASAASYLEKYGPDDRYDFVPLLRQIATPTLILIGELSEQGNPAFAQTLATLAAQAAAIPHVSAERIPGADIQYRGQPEVPWQRFLAWLKINPTQFTATPHA